MCLFALCCTDDSQSKLKLFYWNHTAAVQTIWRWIHKWVTIIWAMRKQRMRITENLIILFREFSHLKLSALPWVFSEMCGRIWGFFLHTLFNNCERSTLQNWVRGSSWQGVYHQWNMPTTCHNQTNEAEPSPERIWSERKKKKDTLTLTLHFQDITKG